MNTKLLTPITKKAVIDSGKAVYLGYLTLDFCTNSYYSTHSSAFHFDNHPGTFKDYLINQLKKAAPQTQSIGPIPFTLNGKTYAVNLQKSANSDSWSVLISQHAPKNPQDTPLKALNEYTSDECMSLVQNYPMTLSQEPNGEYKIGLEITVGDKKIAIGGSGKIELYQLHINNLYAMLQHLSQAADDGLHMLIAMATGSGKSFTQALCFLVLYLADCSCIFTTPTRQLVDQLKRDFSRLLPATVTQMVDTPPAGASVMPQEGGEQKPLYAITTAHDLLTHTWAQLNPDASKTPVLSNDLFVFFDEEHETTGIELFKKRIQRLAKKIPLIFLSATPSQEAYKICGDQSVATLSSQEKEQLGIAKPSASKIITAELPQSKNKTFMESLILTFVDAIEGQRTSPAHAHIEETERTVTLRKKTDPFYAKTDGQLSESNIRRLLRWNVHCPIGDNELLLTGDHDAVVNLNNIFNGDRQDPYKNGNRISRASIYNFFGLGENLDNINYLAHHQAISDVRKAHIAQYLVQELPGVTIERANQLINEHINFEFDLMSNEEQQKFLLQFSARQNQPPLTDTKDYLAYRVLHGVIENTLHFLTDCDTKKLDESRFHDLDGLANSVIQSVNRLYQHHLSDPAITQTLTQKLVNEGLPDPIATEVAQAMLVVIQKLHDPLVSLENKRLMVDNWQLDKKVHQLFGSSTVLLNFTEKFKQVFFVNGLEKSATPIQKNKPFFQLKETGHRLKDYEPAKKAPLKHDLSTMEVIDDATEQKVYEPIYQNNDGQLLTPSMVDTLFRKGLIGVYVTNERVCGFNDVNLNHVGMVVGSVQDSLNTANQIIQGFGRNRGLNPARQHKR